MDIEYKNNRLKRSCEQASASYGQQAKKVVQRLDQLYAAIDLTDIQKIRVLHMHPLEGEWKGCFAIDVNESRRIIFEPIGSFDILDYKTITRIKILEVNIDYH